MENQPKTIKEALENLNNAFRYFCITAFEMDKVMQRLSQLIKKAQSYAPKRKSYQSPYAIFDKRRNRKRWARNLNAYLSDVCIITRVCAYSQPRQNFMRVINT